MPTLTLLTTTGAVHQTAGLNWGSNPNNHTTPYDAYIPLHIDTIRRNAPFFPQRGINQKIITLAWDDGVIMNALFEASQIDSRTGVSYPKQISSTPSKNILGRYFRSRLNVSPSHHITLNDLNNYGRTTVDFTRTGLNQFYVDFHV